MPARALLFVQLALSLSAYALGAAIFLLPRLDRAPLRRALLATTWPETLRHIGLTLLAPGFAAATLDDGFRRTVALGDGVTAGLSLVAVLALHRRWSAAVALIWLCHGVGLADLLRNLFLGARLDAAPHLGAAWPIIAFGVPFMLLMHLVTLRTLLRRRGEALDAPAAGRA